MNKLSKMLKKFILPIAATTLVFASASCGRVVETAEKADQDKKLSDKNVVTIAQNLFVKNVLATKYNENNVSNFNFEKEFEKTDSMLFNNAYDAFTIYALNKLSQNSLYFVNMWSIWTSAGIFTDEELKLIKADLQQIDKVPSKDTFKVIYLNEKTGVANDINNLLLVLKYFDIKDEESLKKLDTNFDSDKENMDLNYLNLIKYVLDKKPIQKWGFETTQTIDIFSATYKFVNNIEDYQKSAVQFASTAKTIDPRLIISNNQNFEENLSGYQGVLINSADSYNLDYSVNFLKSANLSALSGFFGNEATSKSLINVRNNLLVNPIPLYNKTTKKITATYINMLAPTHDEQNKLTFKNSPYLSSINKMIISFALIDKDLINLSIKAFVKLGYSISTSEKLVADLLKGNDFYK